MPRRAYLRRRGECRGGARRERTLTQTDEANMPRIIDALKETARRISRQLQRSGTAGAA